MKQARALPVALALEDGRVLVAGGTVTVFDPKYEVRTVSAVEVWDPKRDKWSAGEKLVKPDGTLVGVKGLEWNAVTRAWKQVTGLPTAPTPGELVLGDGARLRMGGAVWQGSEPHGARETEVDKVELKPLRGRAKPGKLLHGRIHPALTLLAEGQVLVTGGYQTSMDFSWETTYKSVREAEVFEPETGKCNEAGVLARARHDHTAVLRPDRSVMLIGGKQDDRGEMIYVELGTWAER